jgi:hypothetical protein
VTMMGPVSIVPVVAPIVVMVAMRGGSAVVVVTLATALPRIRIVPAVAPDVAAGQQQQNESENDGRWLAHWSPLPKPCYKWNRSRKK